MANKMRLRVATPDSIKFDDEVELTIMRCISGDMGILAYHEATSAILDYGVLRILSESGERRMAVFGGITQVQGNTVTMIANSAQWPEEIDVASVESIRSRLENQLKEDAGRSEKDMDLMMRQCLVQLEVGNYSGAGKSEHAAV